MKSLIITILLAVLIGCSSNPAAVQQTVVEGEYPEVITGTVPCDLSGQFIVNIDQEKYCYCVTMVKNNEMWAECKNTADFEKGIIVLSSVSLCAEYRLLLW